MPWIRNKDQNFLYSLTWDDGGYIFTATDLVNAYEEKLNIASIEARGEQLDNALALSTPKQVSAFLNVIFDKLKSGEGVVCEPLQVKINSEEAGIDVRWVFELTKLPADRAISILGSLVNGLFGAIESLGTELRTRETLIMEKNSVLTGLHDAMQRRVEYRPPRHLEEAYTQRKFDRTPHMDPIELANRFWPDYVKPVLLEPPVKTEAVEEPVKTEELDDETINTEEDSDATRDGSFSA